MLLSRHFGLSVLLNLITYNLKKEVHFEITAKTYLIRKSITLKTLQDDSSHLILNAVRCNHGNAVPTNLICSLFVL